MSRGPVQRRDVLRAGAALGAATLLAGCAEPAAVPGIMLRRLGGSASLRAPARTGLPPPELVGRLWRLAARISARWQLTDFVALDEAGFERFVAAKSSLAPSYLTEYEAAGRILDAVEADAESDPEAFPRLFEMSARAGPATALGRLQKFVIGELMALLVASGGFRAFGLRNYRGFAGGPLADAAHLPYRSL